MTTVILIAEPGAC